MFRLIIFFSLIAIIAAMVLRFWFGLRVIAIEGQRLCRANLDKWMPDPESKEVVQRSDRTAAEFGAELRDKALAQWKKDDKKAAKSRRAARHFGLAVPALSGVVAILGLAVGRIPPMGVIAIIFFATALSAVIGLLSLPAELAAIARTAKHVRKTGQLDTRDDEDAVIRCASAHAWEAALPPILKWIQRPKRKPQEKK